MSARLVPGPRRGPGLTAEVGVHRGSAAAPTRPPSGRWWTVTVPAASGVTRARRLAEANRMARERGARRSGTPAVAQWIALRDGGEVGASQISGCTRSSRRAAVPASSWTVAGSRTSITGSWWPSRQTVRGGRGALHDRRGARHVAAHACPAGSDQPGRGGPGRRRQRRARHGRRRPRRRSHGAALRPYVRHPGRRPRRRARACPRRGPDGAHPGLPLPLEVRYDDYAVDIAENRILRIALHRMALVPRMPDSLVRRLAHLGARLDGVQVLAPGAPVRAWAPSRLNARYQPALRPAEVVLAETRLTTSAGGQPVASFVVTMAAVFEDFLTAAVRGAAAGSARVAPTGSAARTWTSPTVWRSGPTSCTWWGIARSRSSTRSTSCPERVVSRRPPTCTRCTPTARRSVWPGATLCGLACRGGSPGAAPGAADRQHGRRLAAGCDEVARPPAASGRGPGWRRRAAPGAPVSTRGSPCQTRPARNPSACSFAGSAGHVSGRHAPAVP